MAVTNGYCTAAELKARIGANASTHDDEIDAAINAASRMIDGYCQQVFYSEGSVTRVYQACSPWLVKIDPLISISTLKHDSGDNGTYDYTWSSGDYELRPVNGIMGGRRGLPYFEIHAIDTRQFPTTGRRNRVQVAGTFGWSATPDDVVEACKIQATSLFKRKDSANGVVAAGDFAFRVGGALDPDVRKLLAPYVRPVA